MALPLGIVSVRVVWKYGMAVAYIPRAEPVTMAVRLADMLKLIN